MVEYFDTKGRLAKSPIRRICRYWRIWKIVEAMCPNMAHTYPGKPGCETISDEYEVFLDQISHQATSVKERNCAFAEV